MRPNSRRISIKVASAGARFRMQCIRRNVRRYKWNFHEVHFPRVAIGIIVFIFSRERRPPSRAEPSRNEASQSSVRQGEVRRDEVQ